MWYRWDGDDDLLALCFVGNGGGFARKDLLLLLSLFWKRDGFCRGRVPMVNSDVSMCNRKTALARVHGEWGTLVVNEGGGIGR
jgi:hypothetical protein